MLAAGHRRLKHFLSLNEGGVWGDDPGGMDDTLVLRSTDIALDGTWALKDPAVRSLSTQERFSKRLAENDLVVVKSSGSALHLGKTALVDAEIASLGACFANFVQRLRPSTDACPRYLWYLLNSEVAAQQTELMGTTTTGLRNLNGEILGLIACPDMPLSQQQMIADYLDTETARIDALIAKKQRMTQLLTEQAWAWALRLVLGDPDQRGGRRSPSGLYRLVPTEWSETTLRHLGCGVQTGPFGSQLHAEEYVEGEWPVVNPMNIVGGEIVRVDSMTVNDSKRQELSRHVLRAGDIVFARRGEMGRAGLVAPDHEGWLCGTGSLRLRLHGPCLVAEYLKLLLETPPAKAYFELSSVGSTMDNLNSEIVLALPTLVPPREGQNRIITAVAERRKVTRTTTERLNQQIGLLVEHRQTLITAAVTGEIAVPGVAV